MKTIRSCIHNYRLSSFQVVGLPDCQNSGKLANRQTGKQAICIRHHNTKCYLMSLYMDLAARIHDCWNPGKLANRQTGKQAICIGHHNTKCYLMSLYMDLAARIHDCWNSGKLANRQTGKQAICIGHHNTKCYLMSLYIDTAAGNLNAGMPECRFAGSIPRQPGFWKSIYYRNIYATKLISIILLSVYLLFLSGCTTRKNLRQNLFLSWPLKTTPKISQNFSLRSPHDGIDIVAPMHGEIVSAHEGYVVYAGNGYRGYGNLIILDSGQGWSSFYAHLNRVFVKEGIFVKRGDVIGTIGMTGKASGPHLHFELRRNKIPVDPKRYLP